MPTARKFTSNQRSMSRQSRNSAYAAINILWMQMRPDLRFEDKATVREERLSWISSFLGLKKLDSTTKLSDGQIGKVLDEMKRLTGQASKPQESNTKFTVFNNSVNPKSKTQNPQSADIIHLASEEQRFTLEKIAAYIGWTAEQKENFLKARKFAVNFKMLTFKKATALTIILLNIAAQKDLKAKGETYITRKMTAEYMPVLKKKLGIAR